MYEKSMIEIKNNATFYIDSDSKYLISELGWFSY